MSYFFGLTGKHISDHVNEYMRQHVQATMGPVKNTAGVMIDIELVALEHKYKGDHTAPQQCLQQYKGM